MQQRTPRLVAHQHKRSGISLFTSLLFTSYTLYYVYEQENWIIYWIAWIFMLIKNLVPTHSARANNGIFLVFSENRLWHFIQIVSLHEMSVYFSGNNKKNISKCHLLYFFPSKLSTLNCLCDSIIPNISHKNPEYHCSPTFTLSNNSLGGTHTLSRETTQSILFCLPFEKVFPLKGKKIHIVQPIFFRNISIT